MTAETTDDNEAPEPVEAPEAPDDGRLPDDHPAVKALAKANAEAEKFRLRVKEFEDRDKSEAEKAAEEAAELKKALTDAEARAVRFELALNHGLSASQARRLVGDSREELEADAEELVRDLGLDKQETGMPRRPTERLRSGAAPEAEPEETDPRKLAAELPRY